MSGNRMFTWGLLGALALTSLASVGPGLAEPKQGSAPDRSLNEPGRHARGPRREGFGMREGRASSHRERLHELLRGLDLTAEQREKIADIHDRQARKATGMRAEIQIARLDLRKLLRSERPDRGAIDRQIDRIARLNADLRKSQIGTLLDMRAILTPEQQRKVHERMWDGGA